MGFHGDLSVFNHKIMVNATQSDQIKLIRQDLRAKEGINLHFRRESCKVGTENPIIHQSAYLLSFYLCLCPA